MKATVQLVGYALSSAPEHIKVGLYINALPATVGPLVAGHYPISWHLFSKAVAAVGQLTGFRHGLEFCTIGHLYCVPCVQAAAEARLCPLPDLNLQLALPSTQQRQQQQQDQLSSHAAAPSMPRPAGQVMPLRKMPPAFVLILAPLADFWGTGRTLPLGPKDVAANRADLQACETMATAVLAAKRGGCCVCVAVVHEGWAVLSSATL